MPPGARTTSCATISPFFEAVDADRSGIDVAVAVERERAEDAVLDLGREELLDDRCPRSVGARDRVEEHLGGLGGLRSPQKSRLADVVAELANELLARRREQLGGNRGARHEHALAGGSELLCDEAVGEAVGRDELDAPRKRRSEVLDELLALPCVRPARYTTSGCAAATDAASFE